MPRSVPTRVPVFLFLLFFFGLAPTVLTFVDLHWIHWLTEHFRSQQGPSAVTTTTPPSPDQVEQLRQSILNVRVTQCGQNGGENVGTGFVIKAGYIATAAHILGDQQTCNGKIRLIDFKGRELSAALEALSATDDLALLRISDRSLPPLQLADSASYEAPHEVVRLVTIGYPLENAGVSTPDRAAISSEGSLSSFDHEHNVFITSGLNINHGNSGGPVFLRKNWQVLGVVRAKLREDVGQGIGYVASTQSLKSFFREKTAQELP